MSTQIARRSDHDIASFVDEHPNHQQQIVYVTVDGPMWIQMLLNAPPETLLPIAAIAGIAGGVVLVSLLILAAIIAQFAAAIAVAVVAGVVGITALGVISRT